MKKTTAIFILINVFFLMVANVMTEYNSMKNSTQSIQATVSNSTEAAISAVLSSEEFFSSSRAF